MARKPFPQSVRTDVLIVSRRICAFCFGLHGDVRIKEGQIAHIDDPQDIRRENAAFLCLNHHHKYDSRSRQAKGLTLGELKFYLDLLDEQLKQNPAEVLVNRKQPQRVKQNDSGVSLALYDRRLPIYKAAMQFVRDVVGELRPDWKLIFQFGRDTDEALFLFDDHIANYIVELSQRAHRLHVLNRLREDPKTAQYMEPAKMQQLIVEDSELVAWFSVQHNEIRARFAPFLRLSMYDRL